MRSVLLFNHKHKLPRPPSQVLEKPGPIHIKHFVMLTRGYHNDTMNLNYSLKCGEWSHHEWVNLKRHKIAVENLILLKIS